MYPSKIMTNSLTVADDINVSMHNLNSKFLQMESKYNINNEHYRKIFTLYSFEYY